MTSSRIQPRQAWWEKDSIRLSELTKTEVEALTDRQRDRYAEPTHGSYFQSPVDKSAKTFDPAQGNEGEFSFNSLGVLEDPIKAGKALVAWLRSSKEDIDEDDPQLLGWLKTGDPGNGVLFDKIQKALRESSIGNEELYNKPICRLVAGNQLRYDANYQAIYQLTPGQIRLMDTETRKPGEQPKGEALLSQSENEREGLIERFKRNQRAYWGLSETFQSLVAMFDSDLGRGADFPIKKSDDRAGTKEFVRIRVHESTRKISTGGQGEPHDLSPAGLNRYSPLRFWCPPPVFAKSVFHMLFWRSLITGKDLFKRDVLPSGDITARADYYYVIVNWFNASKFRIADYANLFYALLSIARRLTTCKTVEMDLSLPNDKDILTRVFYPRYFPTKFQEFDDLELLVPFASAYAGTQDTGNEISWELTRAYEVEDPRENQLDRRLLRFLRDRALELILWSDYQMEIRSVGMIPIQHLYQISLDPALTNFFEEMKSMYKHRDQKGSSREDVHTQIRDKVLAKMKEPGFNDGITLLKAFGGPHRDILRKGIVSQVKEGDRSVDPRIEWLARYNSNPTSNPPTLEGPSQNRKIADKGPDPRKIYKEIDQLQCLRPMVHYYQCILGSIRCFVGASNEDNSVAELTRMSFDQVRLLRRYINSDLEHFGLEFYLQRLEWARECRAQLTDPALVEDHLRRAIKDPARHPCQMRDGFVHVVCQPGAEEYTYKHFLGQTLNIFVAIHSHLVSINRALGDLYYYVTEAPFAAFTPAGQNEIRHLTRELNRIMRGLLVATHLQPQEEWQHDLISYLVTCRADCERFVDCIPAYYQTHRTRLVLFQIDPIAPGDGTDPYIRRHPHFFPLACLPWSAGVYRDFLSSYENIAIHTLAVFNWAIRLYSLWYFVPRRYLRLVSAPGT